MSNDEQQARFIKIEKTGFKITIMQGFTIASLLFAAFSWYQQHDEKSIIDASTLSNKIDNVLIFVKNSHSKDSIINCQQRTLDSLSLNNKFTDLKTSIVADINRKLILHEKRLSTLERRSVFFNEVKKDGPTGPVSFKPVQNR